MNIDRVLAAAQRIADSAPARHNSTTTHTLVYWPVVEELRAALAGCPRAGCTNPARRGETFCTRHEDRATYERYHPEATDARP